MKQKFLISLICSISLFIINDIFYLLNLSTFSSMKLLIINNYMLNLIILIAILTCILFVIENMIIVTKIDFKSCFVYSLIIFHFAMILLMIFNINTPKIELSTLLSILFSIFFVTYLYFYSNFYLNVVKYKRLI